jgi:hypothetical protein
VVAAIKDSPSESKWIIREGPEMASVPLFLEKGTNNG